MRENKGKLQARLTTRINIITKKENYDWQFIKMWMSKNVLFIKKSNFSQESTTVKVKIGKENN